MKTTTIIILIAALTLVSCKKEDALTKEDLDEAIGNIDNGATTLFDKNKLYEDVSFLWRNTTHLSQVIGFYNGQYTPSLRGQFKIDRKLTGKFYWQNNYERIIIDCDTNNLDAGNTFNSIKNSPTNSPYLSELYLNNKFIDQLDLYELTDTSMVFYSNTLNKIMYYERY